MNITIERATLNDVERVAPLFDLYRQFYGQSSDVNGAIKFLSERLRLDQSVIFIAVDDGKVAGFVQLYPIFSSVGMKKAWLLNDLYVDEFLRKKGVAAALLNAAKEWGAETQSGWLMLQTSSDNFSAQSLYEKNGWEREKDFFYTLNIS
jgi:GNAT superfamily N-acetyltransferase